MSSGHSFAMSYAARNLSELNRTSEELSGVSYLKFLQSIKDEDYPTILGKIIVRLFCLLLTILMYCL